MRGGRKADKGRWKMNKNGSRWLPKWKRLAIYMRDNFSCAYCGRNLKDAPYREVTLDHLECRVNGGNHNEDNLITARLSCNSARRHTPLAQFASKVAIRRIKRLIVKPLNAD